MVCKGFSHVWCQPWLCEEGVCGLLLPRLQIRSWGSCRVKGSPLIIQSVSEREQGLQLRSYESWSRKLSTTWFYHMSTYSILWLRQWVMPLQQALWMALPSKSWVVLGKALQFLSISFLIENEGGGLERTQGCQRLCAVLSHSSRSRGMLGCRTPELFKP